MANQFLLYGANGYTGQLIARYASHYHLQPVLAGRNKEAILKLSRELNLPYLVVDLEDPHKLEKALSDFDVVMHAAGPFNKTALPMAEACIRAGTHYLDINGDIAVFEALKLFDEVAKKSRINDDAGGGF